MAFTLSYGASHEEDPAPIEPRKVLAATDTFWRDWSRHCAAGTHWDDILKRSLLTLKALIPAATVGRRPASLSRARTAHGERTLPSRAAAAIAPGPR